VRCEMSWVTCTVTPHPVAAPLLLRVWPDHRSNWLHHVHAHSLSCPVCITCTPVGLQCTSWCATKGAVIPRRMQGKRLLVRCGPWSMCSFNEGAASHLEESFGGCSTRMHHTLRNALTIKVGNLLHQMIVCKSNLRMIAIMSKTRNAN
jgi:hypothetical protein